MLANTSKTNIDISQLLDPEAFPHDVTELQIIETHISWVILTGQFAYKIKKPVKFDFVDYSTLQRRKRFCEKEVELNRRFAPELYLDVIPIYESEGRILCESGETHVTQKNERPVEYAVKMRQFSQDSIIAARLQSPELTPAAVEEFGTSLARFHDSIEAASPTLECVQTRCIRSYALENFPALLNAFRRNEHRRLALEKLEQWTVDEFAEIEPEFSKRLSEGKVRLCHGDMHLKNIIQIDGRLMPFDGIEFNDQLQWIDVLSELAFPVMDFVARGRSDLGWRLLNAYLEFSGDYDGLRVLRFYLVYRSLVRAKVTWLNPENHTPAFDQKTAKHFQLDELGGPWDKYLTAAWHFAFEFRASIAITHGFSGSGKSTDAMSKIDRDGGVRIRSDVERHRIVRLLNKTENEYSQKMSDRVYDRLLKFARTAIESGLPVVVDATFLKRELRLRFWELANESNVDFKIIESDAPFEELCHRIRNRGPDPSEATIDVLRMQMASSEPLTDKEIKHVWKVAPRQP